MLNLLNFINPIRGVIPLQLIHGYLQPFTFEPKAVIWAHEIIFRCMDNAHGNVIGRILHQYTVLGVGQSPGAVLIKFAPVMLIPCL